MLLRNHTSKLSDFPKVHSRKFFYQVGNYMILLAAVRLLDTVSKKYIQLCIFKKHLYIKNILNLQTVLFRPLRSHQCSSEWFENWDMSIAQQVKKYIKNIYIYMSSLLKSIDLSGLRPFLISLNNLRLPVP